MKRVTGMMMGAAMLLAFGAAPIAAEPGHRHHPKGPHEHHRPGPPPGGPGGPGGPGPAHGPRPGPPPEPWEYRDYVRVPEPRRVSPRRYYVEDCPRGMVLRGGYCEYPRRYGHRVGDILPRNDYSYIDDPYRYDLEQRQGWSYYRDDNSIYRVDSGTRKVLAVLNLLQALSQ